MSMLEPILLKLQNSIGGVFQCIFNKISENVFYKTTMNWYFGTKKGRCKYWSSIVLFESEIKQSSYFLIFVTSFCSVSFLGGYFKECLWPRKSNKNIAFVGKERFFFFFWETKRCSAKMLVGKVVPRKITEEFTFVNRTTDV